MLHWETPETFAPLTMPQRNWADGDPTRYRIYKTPEDFDLIEAETASQAIGLSGTEQPFKVQRFIQGHQLMVKEDTMSDVQGYIPLATLDQLTKDNPLIDNPTLEDLRQQPEPEPEPPTEEAAVGESTETTEEEKTEEPAAEETAAETPPEEPKE